MHVDDDRVTGIAKRAGGESPRGGGERIVQGRHEQLPHDLYHQNPRAVFCGEDVGAATRRSVRIIRWPDEALLALGENQRFLLVPGVVAGGNAIGAGLEEIVKYFFGNAQATGGVFAVDDDEIEAMARNQAGQVVGHGLAACAADDVAEKQDLHGLAFMRGSLLLSRYKQSIHGRWRSRQAVHRVASAERCRPPGRQRRCR